MREVLNSKTFWTVYIIAAIAIFVMSVNAGRVYEAETALLIIPKSSTAVKNSEQIMENLRQIPASLAFYTRMVEANEDTADEATLELPDYKKKAYWNASLQVSRVGTSGVLKIIARSEDRYQAEVLSAEAAKMLISTAAGYYNIETDLDVRIIDPTITNHSAGTVDYVLFFESAIGAFLAIFTIFFLSLTLFKKEEAPAPAWPDFFSKENGAELPIEKFHRATSLAAEKKWPAPTEEKPYTDFINMNKSASAPANLPIAENEKFLDITVEPKTPEPEDNKEENSIAREATTEEVKARLNKLLSGKL